MIATSKATPGGPWPCTIHFLTPPKDTRQAPHRCAYDSIAASLVQEGIVISPITTWRIKSTRANHMMGHGVFVMARPPQQVPIYITLAEWASTDNETSPPMVRGVLAVRNIWRRPVSGDGSAAAAAAGAGADAGGSTATAATHNSAVAAVRASPPTLHCVQHAHHVRHAHGARCVHRVPSRRHVKSNKRPRTPIHFLLKSVGGRGRWP